MMNRTQLAGAALTASAMILAGLLIVQMQRHEPPTPYAVAEQVINTGAFSLMTAKTRDNEEALFMLDNLNEKLLIYRLDLGRKRLELAGSAEISEIFARLNRDRDDRQSR